MRGWLGMLVAAVLMAGAMPGARAQGIYTCVDARGRKLTSDRPIIDCIDREQREITPSGQVVRKIGPSLTAEERAAQEEKERRAADERNRQMEERRRDRALLVRYPDRATHDRERAAALATIDEVIKTANRRVAELQGQRRKLQSELEFYKGDAAKVPPLLKRQLEENEQLLAGQARFIANQEEEKKRMNARYDEELQRLSGLWTQHAVPVAASAASQAQRK